MLIQNVVKQTICWMDDNFDAKREEYEQKKKGLEQIWKSMITNI